MNAPIKLTIKRTDGNDVINVAEYVVSHFVISGTEAMAVLAHGNPSVSSRPVPRPGGTPVHAP